MNKIARLSSFVLFGLILGLTRPVGAAPAGAGAKPPAAASTVPTAGPARVAQPDGRVLRFGADGGPATARIDAFSPDGSVATLPVRLLHARSGHTATALPDGGVLVLGGVDERGAPVTAAERFDPTTSQISDLGSLGLLARRGHAATVLTNGRVLITGGTDARGAALDAVEFLNIAAGQPDRSTVRLNAARSGHTSSLLPTGDVLIQGGRGVATAELFEAGSQRFSLVAADQAVALRQSAEAIAIPAVQASVPAAEAVGVAGDQPLVVRFGSRMDLLSVGASVTLVGPHGPIAAKAVPAEQGLLLFVWPAQELLPATRYTLFINGAVDRAAQRLPLTAIGFDTAAKPGIGSASASGGTSAASSSAASDAAARQAAAQREAEAVVDDELWVPQARHRKGDWTSGRADLALQAQPRRAFLRNKLYGERVREQAILQQRARDKGLSWPADGKLDSLRKSTVGSASSVNRTPVRLTWADIRPGGDDGLPQAPAGTTALAGQVLRLNGKPLANVTLSLGNQTVRTDDQGEFLLSNIQPGSQMLAIDGRSANRADAKYGHFQYRLDLEAGKTNALPFVVWMPKLDMRHAVRIESPTLKDTVITHPLLPGLELTLAAGTVIRDADGKVVNEVSITPIPVDQTPFPMPYFGVPIYFTLQPGGAVIQGVDGKPRGATLRYPNYTSFGPGQSMRLFDYDPKGRGWYIYANARVSADGQSLQAEKTFQIYQFSATSASSGGSAGAGGNAGGCGGGSGPGGGGGGGSWSSPSDSGGEAPFCTMGLDPVDLSTGHFSHTERDLLIPDITPIDIRRSYRTLDNNGSTAQYVRAFGVGTTHPYEVYLYLPPPTYSEVQLVLPDGRTIRFLNLTGGCYACGTVFQNSDATGEYHGAYVKYSSADGALVLYFKDGRRWGFATYSARLLWTEDAVGNRTTVERPNSSSYVTRVIGPTGRYVSFAYNTQGLVSDITDNLGRQFSYTYDSGARLTEVTDPLGGKRQYTWDVTNNRITSIRDPNGNVMVTNEYDAAGRVSRQTLADGSSFVNAYTVDANGQVTRTQITDRRGAVRRVDFNAAGLITSSTHALGQPEERTTTRSFTNGLLTSQTDPLGRTTAYEYDSFGNLTKITRLSGTANAVVTTMTWDTALSRVLSVTNPNGLTTAYSYDAQGQLLSATDPLGQRATIAYDPQGRPLTLTDANGHATTLGYDGADLASITDALNRKSQVFTDGVGRTMSSVEPLGQRSLQDYDALNRLTRSTDALGQSLNYAYDANGNLLSHTDARGNVTRYTYTASGQVASKQDALLATETNLYEPGGKLRQRIDRKGQLSAITRDVLGRVKTIGFGTTASAPTAYQSTVTLTWDAADRLTQIVERTCANPTTSLNCATVASTRTITRTYDALDRMTQEVSPQGEVNYTYDAGGRKTSMTVKNGAPGAQTTQPAITYTYDNADRLTGISQAAGATNANQAQAIVFAYDAANRRTRTTLANGSTVTYSYDPADQLIAMEHRKSDGSLLGDLSYSYDANGRRTGMGGSLARISLPTDTTDASYNANNQLTRWSGSSFAYDANGNLTSDGTSSYQWDERNQLRAITGTATANFQYDAFGRRSGKTINATPTGFLYGGLSEANFVQELEGTLNTSAVRATSITAGVDEALLREEGTQLLSALIDGNNNTVQLSDQTQTKTVGYTYEAYGKTTSDATTSTNSQQYTGRENDNPGTANGLYYYRARYYMPGCGRFISEDPIGWASGQANNYAYVGGDPVGFTDPAGLAPHQYEWSVFRCMGDCTLLTMKELRCNPAPGVVLPTQIQNGDRNDVSLGPIALGPIATAVDVEQRSITNITLPGHMLYPGWVHRQVRFDGKATWVDTSGGGDGPFPLLNSLLAPFGWGGTSPARLGSAVGAGSSDACN